jgi:LDH2 family malate/lactate/ureidoglycolate dehydrogenase
MTSTDPRIAVDVLTQFGSRVLTAMGCQPLIAAEVAEHLVEADLCGVYSHGIFRLDWYAERAALGKFVPGALPKLVTAEGGADMVDGGHGLGMPAFRLATDHLLARAAREGMAAIGVSNVDHTGRIGAFAQRGAEAGCLTIMLGGGSRKDWPQVAPYGGAHAMLPTNPYAFGIPGGARGPVVIDFATGMAAGGKIYAAKMAGRPLAEGLCIDAQGRPTTNPDDYFNGGAILPMAGPKGYGMALVAELLGEAILGQARDGMNWICLAIDLTRFRAPGAYQRAAEECLAELRACTPAPGFERVEIPGEREASLRAERLVSGIPIPPATLDGLRALGRRLGLEEGHCLA